MPAFSPMGEFKLTSTQIDLIVYALNNVELSPIEDDERRKVFQALDRTTYVPGPFTPPAPYDNLCDI